MSYNEIRFLATFSDLFTMQQPLNERDLLGQSIHRSNGNTRMSAARYNLRLLSVTFLPSNKRQMKEMKWMKSGLFIEKANPLTGSPTTLIRDISLLTSSSYCLFCRPRVSIGWSKIGLREGCRCSKKNIDKIGILKSAKLRCFALLQEFSQQSKCQTTVNTCLGWTIFHGGRSA